MAPASRFPAALQATEEDISLLLNAQSHIGAKQVEKKMTPYVYVPTPAWPCRQCHADRMPPSHSWKRRADGVNLINLGKTFEKITLAARAIGECCLRLALPRIRG